MPEPGGGGGHGTEAQLAVLSEKVEQLREAFDDLRERIDGPPWERSMRGRLHRLEAESAAATMAAAALAEARRERRRSEASNRARARDHRTFGWKVVGTITAAALAAYPYLAHAFHWHG